MYKVLIVEDEKYLLQELSRTFEWERYGCTIIGTAADGETARIIASQESPDIIVTDIQLPGMSGLDLLRELMPQTAIIITGHDRFEYAREALRIGVIDFLLKPIDDAELHSSVRKATIFLAGHEGNFENSPHVPDATPAVDNKKRHVISARRFIERHYSEDISLLQIAQNLGLSESYLSRIFRECTGSTFVELLTEHRINVARNLLRDQRLRIDEIAEMSGFRTAGYFTRIFKRFTGMSPSRFRCCR